MLHGPKDTLCDEIEDATEDDTPYELWVINKRVRNEDGKYKAEYRQGYWNSITRTNEADGIAEFETEFGVYLKNNVVMLHYRKQSNKTKRLWIPRYYCTDPADDGLAESIPQPTEAETV